MGQQALELDFLAGALIKRVAERKAMIDRDHELPITRQAELLASSRNGVYYLPRAVSDGELALMRRIKGLHLEHPFMGARMLRAQLHATACAWRGVTSPRSCSAWASRRWRRNRAALYAFNKCMVSKGVPLS